MRGSPNVLDCVSSFPESENINVNNFSEQLGLRNNYLFFIRRVMHRMPKEMCRESQQYFKMYEHSALAHRQWSRLMDSVLSSGADVKGAPLTAWPGTHHPSFGNDRPAVDPAIIRLIERHDAVSTAENGVGFVDSNSPAYDVDQQLSPPRWADDGDARTVNGFRTNNGEILTDRDAVQNGDLVLSEEYNPDGQTAWRISNKIYAPGLPGYGRYSVFALCSICSYTF